MSGCVCWSVMRICVADNSAIWRLMSCWILVVAVRRSLADVSSVLSCSYKITRLTEIVRYVSIRESRHCARCWFRLAFCWMKHSKTEATCVSLFWAAWISEVCSAKRRAWECRTCRACLISGYMWEGM